MVAYSNSGDDIKAMEVNHWLFREHPDYLFGKINLAAEYYMKEEYDKIPEVLGKLVGIYLINSLGPLKILCFLRIFILMPGLKSRAVSHK